MRRLTILALSCVVAVVLFFVLCTFRVRPYEVVVLSRFGRMIKPDEQATIAYGWRLCWPTDVVVRLDRRLHLNQTQLTQINTGDQEAICVQAFAAWRISDPVKFYTAFSGNDANAQAFIGRRISSGVMAEVSKYSVNKLFPAPAPESPESAPAPAPVTATHPDAARIDLIEKAVAEDVNLGPPAPLTGLRSGGLNEQGVEVAEVGFSRIAFPPLVAQTVYSRMASERAKQAKRYESEGATEASRIIAEGTKTAGGITAKAQSDAKQIMGEGDSEYLRILSQATADPGALEFYKFWREIELFRTSIGKGTVLIIRTGEPMENLFGSPRALPLPLPLPATTQPGK